MRHALLFTVAFAAFLAAGPLRAEEPSGPVRIQWRRGPDLAQAVGGPAAGVLDGKFIAAGGTFWVNAEKKFWIGKAGAYDPKTETWTAIPDIPQDTAYSCAVSTADAVYVFGGASKEETWTNTWKLVKEGDSFAWKPFVPMPVPLCNMGPALVGSTAYIVAGTKNGNDLATSVDNNVWKIDLAAEDPKWGGVTPLPGPLRCGVAVASCAGKLYAFGGWTASPVYGGSGNHDQAYVFDPAENSWKRIANTPYPSGWWWAATYGDRYVIIAGGNVWLGLVAAKGRPTSDQYGFMPEVLVYDTKNDTYSLSDPLPMGIIDYGFVLIDDTLYLAGGEDAPRHRASWLMIGQISSASK